MLDDLWEFILTWLLFTIRVLAWLVDVILLGGW